MAVFTMGRHIIISLTVMDAWNVLMDSRTRVNEGKGNSTGKGGIRRMRCMRKASIITGRFTGTERCSTRD